MAGCRVKVVEECLIKATEGSVADLQSDGLNGYIGMQKYCGFFHTQLGHELREGLGCAAADNADDLPLTITEDPGEFFKGHSLIVGLNVGENGRKLRLPVEAAFFRHRCSLLKILQQVQKEGAHQRIDHLGAVGAIGSVLQEDGMQ